MNRFVLAALLLVLSSCMEREFGYKNNPAFILQRAHQALRADDAPAALQLLSKHALCHWGNHAGLEALKRALPHNLRDVKPDIRLAEGKTLATPIFVGHWAYYKDVYAAQLVDDRSGTLIAELRIECHFGVSGARRDEDAKIPKLKMPEQHCKVAVLAARSFEEPKARKECAAFSGQL